MYFITLTLALFQLTAFAVGANVKRGGVATSVAPSSTDSSAAPSSTCTFPFKLYVNLSDGRYYVLVNSTQYYTLSPNSASSLTIQGTGLRVPNLGSGVASVSQQTDGTGNYIKGAPDGPTPDTFPLNAVFDANCNVNLTGVANGVRLDAIYALPGDPPLLFIQSSKVPPRKGAQYVPILINAKN